MTQLLTEGGKWAKGDESKLQMQDGFKESEERK